MLTLATDDTDDLALQGGRLSLASGVVALKTRLRGRLSLFMGEWFADLALGIPFLDFLGQKGAVPLAEATLRRALVTCPGVAALLSYRFAFDSSTRNATVDWAVKATDGAVVEDNGFRVGP